MNKYEILLSGEKFYKHPLENCVLRTVPTGVGGWLTYVRFSGKEEYEPGRGSKIIIDSLWNNEPDWITKEEFYNF